MLKSSLKAGIFTEPQSRYATRMLAIFPIALMAAQAAGRPASIAGLWRSPGGNSIINIAPCGDALCGTVAWASAQAKQDARETSQQLVGTAVLTELNPSGDGRWQGKLFIPDKNMRVSAKIQLVSATQLKVSGCLAGKSLCRSSMWTHFDGPVPQSD